MLCFPRALWCRRMFYRPLVLVGGRCRGINHVSANNTTVPDWDLEQLEVILEAPACWQFVIAGPGAGKTAVACQRIAYLIDEAVPPSRLLLASFTRTAVAELRDPRKGDQAMRDVDRR